MFFIVFFVWGGVAYAADDSSDAGGEVLPEDIQCASISEYTKCAKMPDVQTFVGSMGNIIYSGDYVSGAVFSDAMAIDDENWSHVRNGVPIVGRVVSSSSDVWGPNYVYSANCEITSPYSMIFMTEHRVGVATDVNYAELCANVATNTPLSSENAATLSAPIQLDGDTCPDGFFTVPYESWCGDGMVNIADVPSCDEDMSGEYCLMPVLKPCTSGISRLRTSNGVSVPLFAEKSTLPSLAVKYNGITCFANFEPGTADGTLNVVFDGQVYHAQTE